MQRVPRKNIYPFLSDIKIPRLRRSRVVSIPLQVSKFRISSSSSLKKPVNYIAPPSLSEPIPLKKSAVIEEAPLRSPKRILRYSHALIAGFLFLIFVGSGIYAFKIVELKNNVSVFMESAYGSLREITAHLRRYEFGKAAGQIKMFNSELNEIGKDAKRMKLFELGNVLGSVWNAAKTVPRTFLNVQEIGNASFEIVNDVEVLKQHALALMFDQKGNELIGLLENIVSKMRILDESTKTLQGDITAFDVEALGLEKAEVTFGDLLLNNAPEFYKIEDALKAFISFLKQEDDVHALILFQNSSEMRPSGGFIGSYADLVFNHGSILRFDVEDVYDPDGQLDARVIPPKQLQGITEVWGARDANWFFDFPQSADKVKFFLEESKIYKEKNTKFPLVIAINDTVLQSILSLVGPIKLLYYNLTVDSNNFLPLIQEEVEAGKDNKHGEPKRILKVLTPLLLEKLKNLPPGDKRKLFEIIGGHLSSKDIMIHSEHEGIRSFLKSKEWTGESFAIPPRWNGDYIALVNTNIAGGKSDYFIDQEIDLVSQLTLEGDVLNNLIVKRTHSGNTRSEWWYRAINENYIKVLTREGARFGFVRGNTEKAFYNGARYKKDEWTTDRELARIESTMQFLPKSDVWVSGEGDKTSFGTWFRVRAGESKTLHMDYKVPRAFDINTSNYSFVFDKQSGVRSSVTFAFIAPPGYVWKETGTPYMNYESRSGEGRIRLDMEFMHAR